MVRTGWQIIASASAVYDIPWPPVFMSFASVLRVFLVDIISITKANCAQPMNYYASMMILLVGTKVVLVLMLVAPWVFYKVGDCWARRRHRRRAASFTSVQRKASRSMTAAASDVVARRRLVASKVHEVVTRSASGESRGTQPRSRQVPWDKLFRASFTLLFVTYPGETEG